MVLADTSVWSSHLHGVNPRMSEFLRRDKIAIHRLVLGELACGSLQPRDEILEMLSELPESRAASHDEVLDFIEHKQLIRQRQKHGRSRRQRTLDHRGADDRAPQAIE